MMLKVNSNRILLESVGFYVKPSSTKLGKFRWFRNTGGDGVSVPPVECNDTVYKTQCEAWTFAETYAQRNQNLIGIPATINVPDGYNGHTVTLNTKVVQEDKQCVQLRSESAPHLTRWISKTDYCSALKREVKNQ